VEVALPLVVPVGRREHEAKRVGAPAVYVLRSEGFGCVSAELDRAPAARCLGPVGGRDEADATHEEALLTYIAAWNDEPGRAKSEVLEAMDDAIRRCAAELRPLLTEARESDAAG
jgi:hypothetical protein